ncbi:MarC family protein [Pyrofollis japonicus]|uniref:MarC family protein n=1 Tax=Pyrofollis japonicus TaxID=3060460 RepID=UPI00295A7B44|nr:MarC family protein [Pyrofollis japonicus]BEP17651.1 MarC family protein [Pyrofollis japonicus]
MPNALNASINLTYMIHSLTILFIAIDPVGNAPLFYGLTSMLSDEKRQKIVKDSCVVATIILLIFALVGDLLLYYFGLSLADFRIAGGIILLIYGIAGIFGWTEATGIRHPEEAEAIAIVPLATPLLAGPAAIATVLYIKAIYGILYAIISIAVNTAITYAMLAYSEKLLELLGENGALALSKIMSILLAAIAVSMIRAGIVEAIATAKSKTTT